MKKLYRIKINNILDETSLYYKSTAENYVMQNIYRYYELRGYEKPMLELVEFKN